MSNILWEPSIDTISQTNIYKLKQYINKKYSLDISNYNQLHRWSIQNIDLFWEVMWEKLDIVFSEKYTSVIENENSMLESNWFLNSRLNFSENLLKIKSNSIAIEFVNEQGKHKKISYKELYLQVSKVAHSFRNLGLEKGDRVAALMPNIPETVISMLAVSSIGAIWSSCSPDFGSKGILDRFDQIKPEIIISVNGYYFKNKIFNIDDKIANILNKIPSIKHAVLVDYLESGINNENYLSWDELLDNNSNDINFEQLPFDYPLYIMYSSGTTGKPKSIVHSAGGTLIQHKKELKYHVGLDENDKIFYYTTCGWMMWNWLVSSLSIGATVVLFEGSPFYPENDSLLKFMDGIDVNVFGTSAKYISHIKSEGVIPSQVGNFSNLRSVLSTGSPLSNESFKFVYEHWKSDVQLASISGGTDIISCFALGNPTLPVYSGKLQCLGLGMSVKSFNEKGLHGYNIKGELVCDMPFPSMPIYFWNDINKEKYKQSYFDTYDNIWKHGDFILINEEGVEIFGRSDATLNPGGVRIGTAEIYQSINSISYISDSLAVGQSINQDERIVLFVKLKENEYLNEDRKNEISSAIKYKCSPKHVPSVIVSIEDIPYTLNGKKVEIAVKNIIHGIEPKNKSSLSNPESLEYYKNIAEINS